MSDLQILRQAGFFKYYSQLTDEEILDSIHEERKKRYTEIFGYEYDPGRDIDTHKLATQDTTKMLHFDTEADVAAGNDVYIWLSQALEKLSGKENLITDVTETWENETGPIKINYIINGKLKYFEPNYIDDWIDVNFVDNVLSNISQETNDAFYACAGPNSEWVGQDISLMRLTIDEKVTLEKGLRWKFFDEFMKEMNKENS